MINNYLKTSLPMYDHIAKQFRFKDGATNSERIFNLYSSSNALPPLQIRKLRDDKDQIIAWTVYELDGSIAFNLNQNIDILVKNIDENFENYVYNGQELKFRYNNGEIAPLEMCSGMFYTVVQFQSGKKYFSEVFRIDDKIKLSDFIKIDWKGNCKIAGIVYVDDYKNTIYLDAHIEKSIPSIAEEGEKVAGKFIPSTIRYMNRYRIKLISPDWLVETLTMLCLHQDVLITTNNSLYIVQANNLKVESLEWLNPPCYATLELTFEQDEEEIYTSCCS